MSLFDWYEPEPPLSCPVCGAALPEWQGTNGPCLLFVWRQGLIAPVEHRGDGEDFQVYDADLKRWKLPEEFVIVSHDCPCPYPVQAIGHTEQGVWARTVLVTAENARQEKHERKNEFKARLKWLQSSLDENIAKE